MRQGGSVRFILGRAGTGKTHTCLKAIEEILLREGEEGPPLILLVPEQATFQTEYALLSTGAVRATSRAQVLSFRRLARRVLFEVGGSARPWLGELGKRMVLRSLVQKRRNELLLFGRSAGTPGFTERLASTLAELKLYNISPEMLLARLKFLEAKSEGQSPLAGKLHDLALLYRDLEEYLAPRYTDPEAYLSHLATQLLQATSLQGSHVWVDGFSGFTPQEFQVLASLMRTAAQVEIALCLDHRELSRPLAETDLFHPTRETYQKLVALARAEGASLQPALVLDDPTVLPPRFAAAPELAHLERSFFHYPARPWTGDAPGLELTVAANRRVEVEAAARGMIQLARDKGLRWRDMALIVRDLETYQDLITAVLTDYGIPHFVDRKRPVLHHPLSQLVLAALEVFTTNWSYEAVFRALKTDLFPLSRSQVDYLENYVLAYGIRGQCWLQKEDWTFHEADEHAVHYWRAVESLRRRVVAGFQPLTRVCQRGDQVTGGDLTAALWTFLSELKVGSTLEGWARQAEEQGDLAAAQEHTQAWSGFLDLLDELLIGLGDTLLTPVEYAEILASGLESLRLGLVPPSLDQVLVGGLERSRHPNVRAAFVLGINDGVLPGRVKEDAVFTDREREDLKATGLELAPTSRQNQFHEDYLTYIALTRASEFLWLSFPLADEEGRALTPSRVITRLRSLFPHLVELYAAAEPSGVPAEDLSFLSTPERAAGYLAGQLRLARAGQALGPVWAAVYQYLSSEPNLQQFLPRALAGLQYNNRVDPLPRTLARQLYGTPVRTSVTRLEGFASCPFSHFAVYGLKLRERQEYGLDLPSLGLFTHSVLRRLTEDLLQAGRDFADLTPEETESLVTEKVERLVPEFASGILASSARFRYLSRRLTRLINGAVQILVEQARRGGFRTRAAELRFGFEGELPGLTLSLPEGGELILTGQIDRLDVATGADGRNYLSIVDYKSSDHKVSLLEVYHGLSLQLFVYLLAVLAGSEVMGLTSPLPAAVFYFTLNEKLIKTNGPVTLEEAAQLRLKAFRLEGLVRADKEVLLLLDKEAAGGQSSVTGIALKKDGSLKKNPRSIPDTGFDLLLKFVQAKAQQLATAILQGEAQVAPVKQGDATACQFCALGTVCHFDHLVPGNENRLVSKQTSEEIWSLLAKEVQKGVQAE
ncbi:MAG: helicase-exonuclease AddAB subunit AddB [Firmicutes bacterium]|nr:helicase-exonuclease AddAB subunit AddB [Bacillota bacterium]